MSANRDREEEIFDAARELAANDRAAYLAERCGHDTDLRQRIEGMLAADAAAGDFFKTHDGPLPTVILTDASLSPSIEKAGDLIGRYKLLQQIGEGGCGVVYMAEQEEPVRRRVALKVIKLGMDTKQVIARFEAERQALALMDHPNIARVLDAGATETGRPYFVMELVRGIKITEFCDQKELPTQERLDLFLQVCSAVQHAHQKGIIHRDIKPSNILVTVVDGAPVPKVIDFGIAKATNNQPLTDKTVFTAFEQFIGTPAYMSPEQAELSGVDIDTRTDIYSLGVVLYELLTGSPPFDQKELLAAGLDEMRRIIRETEPPRPSNRLSTMAAAALTATAHHRHTESPRLVHSVRGDLDWIAMKCLEKDRARRYETANALAADIRRHLDCEPVVARPPSRWYEFQKTVRRHKFGFAAATAVVLVLMLGVVISTWQAVRATKAEKLANDRLAEVAAERDAKEQARQEAEAISAFMSEVIQSPDPTRDGRTIQVVELLDKAAKKLDTELAAQPGRRAKLQARLASTYYALGLSREAIPLLEKVRDYHLASLGQEHTNTLGSMNNLAITYDAVGRRDEALKLREEVLTLRRKVLGPERPDTLLASQNLANSYDAVGRRDEALKMREEVLALNRKVNGPEHPETLAAMSNLANSYDAVGRRDEALKMREEVLTLRRKVNGPEHPETLAAISNLASSYDAVGRRDEALKMREEVLTVRRKVNGPEHPETLAAMSNLANSYHDAGRRDEALKMREEVLALNRKVLGREHPDTLLAMHNLATSYDAVGRRDEALKLREEVLTLRRKVLGPEHPETLAAMNNLANSYGEARLLDEAFKLREEVLTLCRKVLGPEHPNTLDAMFNLAISYYDAGRLGESLKMREEVLALNRKGLGPEHPDTLLAIQNLATSYDAVGRRDESLKMREEVLALNRKVLGPEHPDTLLAIQNLANSYDAVGRRDEALKLREEVLTLRRKVLGPEHPDTLDIMSGIANSYSGRGRRDEALKMREEVLTLRRKVNGPEHPETLWAMINLAISYRATNRLDEAIELGQSCLEISRRVSGPTNSATLNAMTELAITYKVAGRTAEAIPLEEESLRLKRQHLSPGHAYTIESMGNLAACYEKTDRKPEAEALRREAAELKATKSGKAAERNKNTPAEDERAARERVQSLRSRLPTEDPQLDGPLVSLTQILIDQQKFAEAEEVARQSLANREKNMPDKWFLFNTRSVVGGILMEQKKYAEAEPFLLSGHEGLKQRKDALPAAGKVCLKNSLDRLVRFYEATGQPGKAAEWNQKLTEFDQAGATPKPQSQSQP